MKHTVLTRSAHCWLPLPLDKLLMAYQNQAKYSCCGPIVVGRDKSSPASYVPPPLLRSSEQATNKSQHMRPQSTGWAEGSGHLSGRRRSPLQPSDFVGRLSTLPPVDHASLHLATRQALPQPYAHTAALTPNKIPSILPCNYWSMHMNLPRAVFHCLSFLLPRPLICGFCAEAQAIPHASS